jgi:starvation-inducible DNA-binding protein
MPLSGAAPDALLRVIHRCARDPHTNRRRPMATKKSAEKARKTRSIDASHASVDPVLHQQNTSGSQETQRYGEVIPMPHALEAGVSRSSVSALNQTLADTMTLRDMYKKHHWQVVGPTFNQLHLMYDKHYEAQVELVDSIAERIQVLGGVALAMAADIAEETKIPRPPRGREPASVQLSRLIDAHTLIIKGARERASKAEDAGDSGTNDLLVSEVLRCNELQVWFLSEHLVAATPV